MPRIIMTNCILFDDRTNTTFQGTVAVEDDTITWVGPKKHWLGHMETDGELLDMQGLYVLPGLWDMHVHLGDLIPGLHGTTYTRGDVLFSYRRALAFLNSGVTSLRLVGSGHAGHDFRLRAGIDCGDHVGPHLLTAGPAISSTGGHGYEGVDGCDGRYEFRKAARERLWQGADLLKIMVTGGIGGKHEKLTAPLAMEDEVEAVVEVARRAGKHTAAHVASAEAAIMCSELGVTTIEHGYTLDERACAVMAKNKTAYIPTLSVTHDPSYWDAFGAREWFRGKVMLARDPHRRAVRLAMEAGVTVAIGTDLHTAFRDGVIVTVREMEALEELGVAARDVIKAATTVPASICGLGDRVGRVFSGFRADVIAVRGNPYQSVSRLRDTEFVMVSGKIVKDLLPGHDHPVALPVSFLPGPC